jgi:hypothetical protein
VAKRDHTIKLGKCDCGGQVRGVQDFGRLWTWCEKCTPIEPITLRGALSVSLSSLSSNQSNSK